MRSIVLRLSAGPPVASTVVITAAARPSGDRAQFMVSAFITRALSPSPVYASPGLRGRFAQGQRGALPRGPGALRAVAVNLPLARLAGGAV